MVRIEPEIAPYTEEDISWARWGPKEIHAAALEAIAIRRRAHETVKGIPHALQTFMNTVYALERASTEAGWRANVLHVLLNVSPERRVREAAQKAIEMLQKTMIELAYDEGVYLAVRTYASRKEHLDPEPTKLLHDILRDYRRMGLELPLGRRAELKENLQVLAKLQTAYSKNLNDYKDHITVSRDELAGLPESYIARLERGPKGTHHVSLRYPDLFPFMENAESDAKRAELGEKALRRGGPKGIELLEKMIALRDANARLLGYASHAAFQTEIRMAKNPEHVRKMILDILRRLDPKLRRELRELTVMKRRRLKNQRARLESSDISFYSNHLKQKRYGIDNEKVREYFSLEAVKKGTFAIYEQLFSIRFRRLPWRLWHQDAELYEIREKTGALTGYFALDLHPRDGKYGHAAVFPALTSHVPLQGPGAGHRLPPISVVAANFPKSTPERQSCLTHDEVETFFHEFGHIMHSTLSKTTFASQTGFSTALDFVEAPSQMFESWVWDEKTLALFSGRADAPKKKIPPALAKKLIASRRHMIGYWAVRQLVMALYDQELHGGGKKNIIGLYAKLVERYTGIRVPKSQLFAAGWTHMVEYDAGYYGYMWSRVYGADMFTRFEREGILNPKTGGEYRTLVLEKGASMDENTLVRNFLGREPNNRAVLRELGLR
ncbi:MAG: M3 family metallopeptidase [Patescibacteria group bacterium]